MTKGTIVCVDDERMVLMSLRDQLTHHFDNQYDIELAESGGNCLSCLRCCMRLAKRC